MIQLSSYFIAGFTGQLILITQQTPAWWFPILWGLLLLALLMFQNKLYYPPDHPFLAPQKLRIRFSILLLVLLQLTYFYIQYSVIKGNTAYLESPLHPYVENEEVVKVTGTLQTSVDQDGNRLRFDLLLRFVDQNAVEQPHLIRVQRYAKTEDELEIVEEWNKGDLWQGYIHLSHPQRARNPGAFDYQQFLRNQHIFFTAVAVDTDWNVVHSPGLSNRMMILLDKQRNSWLEQSSSIFSEEAAGIVQAMTVGYRGDLDSRLVDMYQELGIVHILAISGLHVGIVVYSLYTLFMKLPLTREKVIWILMLLIPVFIYLAGAQPSVIRAGLMSMLGLVLQRYGLWKHSLLILYTVYFFNLLYDPLLIYQIGFQLSYFVTFMLIVAYPHVYSWLKKVISSHRVSQAVTIALIAEQAAFPFIAYHFHIFSPLSLFVNLIVVPIYSVLFIPGAFILTLLSFLHPSLSLLGVSMYEWLLQALHVSLEYVYALPLAVLSFGQPSSWWIIGYVIILVLLYIFLELKKTKAGWIMFCVLGLWYVVQISLPYVDPRAHIMVLDVGQGESIVIEAPYRKEVVIIDLGGNVSFGQEEWMQRKNEYEVGRDVVLPYLKYRGINRIDKVVFTHGHYDHYGGIQGILGQVSIREVFKSPIQPISELEREWLGHILQEDIPIRPLRRGDYWNTRHSQFQVLFPQQDNVWMEWTGNPHDYNIVLLNRIYQHSFLWTGDVIETGESEIIKLYPELRVDVLKLAHHGSNTSTSEGLLTHIEPKLGIISVGRNNLYRHPHPDVLSRIEQHTEMKVFRTDLHGGISIKVGPRSLRVTPTLQFPIQKLK